MRKSDKVRYSTDRGRSKLIYLNGEMINKPWFRGESGDQLPLCPKIAKYTASEENYLLQSFRRQAGGLANSPPRDQTDMWLFIAQHYGVPTRLLDWTEGALHALYFAINRHSSNPRIYMLNAQRLNDLAKLSQMPPILSAKLGEQTRSRICSTCLAAQKS